MGLTYREGMTDDDVKQALADERTKASNDYKALKANFDKTASELAEKKKKEKEGLSEAEKQAQKIADLESKVADYEKNTKLRDIKDQYKGLGYDDKSADEIAQAQIDGDFAKVGELQKSFLSKHDEALKKQLLENTPNPKRGDPSVNIPKTKEELKKLGYEGMVKFQETHPEQYAELMNKTE